MVPLIGDVNDPYPRGRGVENDRARRATVFRADHHGAALAWPQGPDRAVGVELEGARSPVLCGVGPTVARWNYSILVPVRAVGIEGDVLDLRPFWQLATHLRCAVSQRRSRVAGTVREVQLDHTVVRGGATVEGGAIVHEYDPPVRQLLGGSGVGEPQVGRELVGGGLHPPALQQGEQDDDADGEDDAHDGDGRQDLGQSVTTLILTTAGNVRPYSAHDVFVGAVTAML
jgi:hypothetical protein